MPWSRFKGEDVTPGASPIDRQNSESIESLVSDYKPRSFSLDLSQTNNTYLIQKKAGSGFIMNDAVKKISGVEEIERKTEEDLINQKVNLKLDEVRQQAFDEAFQQGLDKGFKTATEERHSEINQAIDDFKNLISTIENMKVELVHQNEAHLLTTLFKIAEKIACDHIEQNTELITSIMRQAVEESQEEENITIHVSDKQIEYIESLKKITGRDFDFLRNVKLEPSENVSIGGCIIETNYGSIDARVEKRIENIWSELKKSLPKIKKIAV